MLASYKKLPDVMKNDAVKEYYDMLKKRKISLFLKRTFDIFMSLIMLIIFSPFMLIIAIMIKIDSKGPVFYRQIRITKGMKEFKIFKFRTMVNDADKIGSLVTVGNDSRITRVGRLIRKVRLDELPQLFNVLFGDMSFVGVRPEVKKYVDAYSDEMLATLLLPAGITSPASIKYKDEDELLDKAVDVDKTYIEEVLPEKMLYNFEYLKKFHFHYDLWIMIKTFFAVL